MPKVNKVVLKIEMKSPDVDMRPIINFNTHQLPLENVEITSDSVSGDIMPYSFVHELALVGPEIGTWEIDKMQVTFYDDDSSHSVNWGPIVLDATNQVNLWSAPPRKHILI